MATTISEPERKTYSDTIGNQTCSPRNKAATSMTVADLFHAILHLVTYGQWKVDEKTGVVYTNDVGGLFSTDKSLQIYGFTNRDAIASLSPTASKIFSNLYPFSQGLRDFYNQWRTAHLSATPSAASAVDNDYLRAFGGNFLRNTAEAYDITKWRLVAIQHIRLETWEPHLVSPAQGPGRAPASATDELDRYRLTFLGPGGYPVSFNFAPTDVVFFCSAEPKLTVDYKVGEEKANVAVDAQWMALYPENVEAAKQCVSQTGQAAVPRKTTVARLAATIIDAARNPTSPWKIVPGETDAVGPGTISGKRAMWKVKNYDQGYHVNYISSYKNGLPLLRSTDHYDDNRGLRLVEIERIDRNLWRLRLARTNVSRFLRGNPTIDIFLESSDEVSSC